MRKKLMIPVNPLLHGIIPQLHRFLSEISHAADAADDLHVLIGIIINGKPCPLKADLTGLALKQYMALRILQKPPVILDPCLPVARQRHLHGAHADVLGEPQGVDQGFFPLLISLNSVNVFPHVPIIL